jgi:hypothetical protein
MLTSPIIDVLSSLVSTDKTYRLDFRVVADAVHSRDSTVDNVKNTRWKTYERLREAL